MANHSKYCCKGATHSHYHFYLAIHSENTFQLVIHSLLKNLGHKLITGERRVLSGVYIENIPHWKLVSWSKISRLEFPALEINVKTSNLWPQYIFSEIFLLKQHFTGDSCVVCIYSYSISFKLTLRLYYACTMFRISSDKFWRQSEWAWCVLIERVSPIGTQTSVWIIFHQPDTEATSCGQEVRSVLKICKEVFLI